MEVVTLVLHTAKFLKHWVSLSLIDLIPKLVLGSLTTKIPMSICCNKTTRENHLRQTETHRICAYIRIYDTPLISSETLLLMGEQEHERLKGEVARG